VRDAEVRQRTGFWAEVDRRRARAAELRRRDRLTTLAAFFTAVAVPVLLWHRIVLDIASEFRLSAHYFLAEWTPWLLIVAGLVFFAPVAWSAGSDPESRWYPRSRNAYAGWGITLYLLGLALAVQVAQLYELHAH
jgi:hypothetical protein